MTGLRTIWGVDLNKIKNNFGEKFLNHLHTQAEKFINDDLLKIESDILKTTKKGKFLCDGIASDLFMLNLKN